MYVCMYVRLYKKKLRFLSVQVYEYYGWTNGTTFTSCEDQREDRNSSNVPEPQATQCRAVGRGLHFPMSYAELRLFSELCQENNA